MARRSIPAADAGIGKKIDYLAAELGAALAAEGRCLLEEPRLRLAAPAAGGSGSGKLKTSLPAAAIC